MDTITKCNLYWKDFLLAIIILLIWQIDLQPVQAFGENTDKKNMNKILQLITYLIL